jgi:hypothetical protein
MVKLGRDPAAVGMPLSEFRQSQATVDKLLATLPPTVTLIDPAEALCRAGLCVAAAGDRSLYVDDNHLSTHGAMYLHDVLEQIVR